MINLKVTIFAALGRDQCSICDFDGTPTFEYEAVFGQKAGGGLAWREMYVPGSSKCVKFVPFHQQNLPKGRNFTHLEDPGIFMQI